jgi:hypothetical protein
MFPYQVLVMNEKEFFKVIVLPIILNRQTSAYKTSVEA